jgi:hypothetical protein
MASDWQPITTAFADPMTGLPANGFLLVMQIVSNVKLAGGGLLPVYRKKFTVTGGQAFQDDGVTKLQLPITEDANPINTPIYLTWIDAQDRPTKFGTVIVPRQAGSDPYPPIKLVDILPVG